MRRRHRGPTVICTPPSTRRLSAIPVDPTEHAVQFAREWADRLERYVEERIHELNVQHQIGHVDSVHAIPGRVFFPHDTAGGSVIGPRIGVKSGVLNPDLLRNIYGPAAAQSWARCRLRDRINAVIAREQQEGLGFSHEETPRRSAATPLAITEGARRIPRAMERKR
jgi:hypothetical protein